MNERRRVGNSTERILLRSVLLIHAVAYWWLVFGLVSMEDHPRVIAVGVLLSQCSLLSILAGLGMWSRPVCLLAPFVNAAVTWYALLRILLSGLGEPEVVWWAFWIATNVSILTIGARWIRQSSVGIMRHIRPPEATALNAWQFPIRKLIYFTTAASILFAAVGLGARKGYWSAETIQITECIVMAIVGSGMGLLCMMSLAVLLLERMIHVAIATVAVITASILLAIGLQYMVYWADLDSSPSPNMMILLLLTYVVTTSVSLAIVLRIPLGRFRDFSTEVNDDSVQEPTSPTTNGVTSAS